MLGAALKAEVWLGIATVTLAKALPRQQHILALMAKMPYKRDTDSQYKQVRYVGVTTDCHSGSNDSLHVWVQVVSVNQSTVQHEEKANSAHF